MQLVELWINLRARASFMLELWLPTLAKTISLSVIILIKEMR